MLFNYGLFMNFAGQLSYHYHIYDVLIIINYTHAYTCGAKLG